jgi:hypothetical protein
MSATAGGSGVYNAVDVYNSESGTWSTAQLSVARERLAATSVGNVAIFAGGYGGNHLITALRCAIKRLCRSCARMMPVYTLVFAVALSCMLCSNLPCDERHIR